MFNAVRQLAHEVQFRWQGALAKPGPHQADT
jgi:hypothetical protein